jgi:transcriptional regulator with XRE-family HTH domain
MPVPKPSDEAEPGDILRFYREQQGISQEELGKVVGITNWGIVNIEKGFNPIYYKDAVAFGKTLGIDPDVLLNEYTRFCKPGYGKRIKTIRNLYGVSQYDFAEMLGADRSTVSVWEAEVEEHHPNPENYLRLTELAKNVGIEIEKLIDNPDIYQDEYTIFTKHGFGIKVQKIRKSNGMTREQFARAIGCDKNEEGFWECEFKCPSRPSYYALKRMAEICGIDLDKLNEDPEGYECVYQDFFDKKCGRKIKSIRMAYRMKLCDFGDLLGCTGEAVSKWERNICVPEFKYVKIIERVALKKGITLAQLNECPELFEDDYEAFCKPGYGALLSDIRNSMSVSRAEFARMIGIKPSTYCLWEREQFIPNRDNYNVLKKVLAEKGVSLDEPYRTKNMAD